MKIFTPTPIAIKNKLNSQLIWGFTLMEVIVSAVIVSILTVSLANLFLAGKRHILHSRSRMTSGELGKLFLDPLQMDVRQDTWGSNCLSGSLGACPGPRALSGITYTPTYTINAVGAGSNLRRVKLTITWNEPNP